MSQDPFKLHPLPPEADDSWDDDESIDLDDSMPPLQIASANLTIDEEVALNQQIVVQFLARRQLERQYEGQYSLDVLQAPEGFTQQMIEAFGTLRANRPDLSLVVEVSDGGIPKDDGESEGSRLETLELTRFPLLVGQAPEPVHLPFKDPEVAPLRGYFFQVGRNLIYQDLGGPGGTLLDRVVKGRTRFLNLKGEPSPIKVGDRLVFGGVSSTVVVKEIRPANASSSHPVVAGIAPTLAEAPARAPAPPPVVAPPPPPPRRVEPPPPPVELTPVPIAAPPAKPRARTGLVLGGVAIAAAALLLGRFTAPHAVRVVTASTSNVPASTTDAALSLPGGRSLQIGPSGELRLISPKLARGERFFLLTGADSEEPDPFLKGAPLALGEVHGDNGEASLLFAPSALPLGALAAAPAVQARADDTRVALFMGLHDLQAGQWENAAKVLTVVATTQPPPVAALKGLAFLAMRDHHLEEASRYLQEALKRDASDPEVHYLIARETFQRLSTLPVDSPRRSTLLTDARASYEEAMRQWMLPPQGAFSYKGHELGLKGDALVDEYLKLSTGQNAPPRDTTALSPTSDAAKLLTLEATGSPTDPQGGSRPGGASTGTNAGTNAGANSGNNASGGTTGGGSSPSGDPGKSGGPVASRSDSGTGGLRHAVVRVPDGPFRMGGDGDDPSDEQGHESLVRLSAFQIDKYEVSNARFEQVFPEHREKRGPSAGDNDPAVMASWDEAQAYCRAVGMRLPTEAEWEKAARGADGRTYPWGGAAAQPGLLNFRGNNLGRPTAVDSYPEGASPYGALNMAGNVWEWTADWYDPAYYEKSPATNPTGPASGQRRVIRGGSYGDDASDARASNRAVSAPSARAPKIGFRCARD